jgi:hypothetical protein
VRRSAAKIEKKKENAIAEIGLPAMRAKKDKIKSLELFVRELEVEQSKYVKDLIAQSAAAEKEQIRLLTLVENQLEREHLETVFALERKQFQNIVEKTSLDFDRKLVNHMSELDRLKKDFSDLAILKNLNSPDIDDDY